MHAGINSLLKFSENVDDEVYILVLQAHGPVDHRENGEKFRGGESDWSYRLDDGFNRVNF